MKGYILDWAGNFINYLILLYIFIKSIMLGTLEIFDTIAALLGLIASIMILIYNYKNKGDNSE